MSDDPKVDFYLKNRSLIQEWANLRAPAARALDLALHAEVERLNTDEDVPNPDVSEGRHRIIKLRVTSAPLPCTWRELGWEQGKLLTGAGGWPRLMIVMSPQHPRSLRDVVKNATGFAREAHSMPESNSQWWVRYGFIAPLAGDATHVVPMCQGALVSAQGRS